MAAREKLLAPATTIWWLAAADATDVDAGPAAADMADAVNISCAIVTGHTLGATDSDTDDTRTICDVGNAVNYGVGNYEANLTGIREDDVAATTGVYYQFYNLFKTVGATGFLVSRQGKLNSDAYDSDDEVSWFYVESDYPTDIQDGASPYQLGVPFIPLGDFAVNVVLP